MLHANNISQIVKSAVNVL